MITFGYAKQSYYDNCGTLYIQVRIPSIHGPNSQTDYRGQAVRNYTSDENLPFYPSLRLPEVPSYNEVVALAAMDTSNNQLLVIGSTGGQYSPNNDSR